MKWTSVACAFAALPLAAAVAIADEEPKRATVQSIDFPPGYETLMVIAGLEPGKCTGRHTHPGTESAFVLDGEAIAKIDGRPDLRVKAGQPLLFPPGAVHNVCNVNGKPFRALAHYIVEKGKPLATPAQ